VSFQKNNAWEALRRMGEKCDNTALREIIVKCGLKSGVLLYAVDVLVTLETLERNILIP
jgi:hypothetical protein